MQLFLKIRSSSTTHLASGVLLNFGQFEGSGAYRHRCMQEFLALKQIYVKLSHGSRAERDRLARQLVLTVGL